jgi:hypothetical protein
LLNGSASAGEAKATRIGYSLSQNPVIERFHRTLPDERLCDV